VAIAGALTQLIAPIDLAAAQTFDDVEVLRRRITPFRSRPSCCRSPPTQGCSPPDEAASDDQARTARRNQRGLIRDGSRAFRRAAACPQ